MHQFLKVFFLHKYITSIAYISKFMCGGVVLVLIGERKFSDIISSSKVVKLAK